ncbi:hypothetical protein ACQR1H_31170 [Bradyrhizobium sp. HKCCYLRH2015]|uniref:hypothetical protein n=1 Tax=Bradyrhizobium TaxID=374 RepID=UPI003EBD54EA
MLLPPTIELMIASRGILLGSMPLVKEIAAIGGDEVYRSRAAGTISFNGKMVANVLVTDRKGRPLPS